MVDEKKDELNQVIQLLEVAQARHFSEMANKETKILEARDNETAIRTMFQDYVVSMKKMRAEFVERANSEDFDDCLSDMGWEILDQYIPPPS